MKMMYSKNRCHNVQQGIMEGFMKNELDSIRDESVQETYISEKKGVMGRNIGDGF